MINEKLKELGIELAESPSTFGAYVPYRISGNTLYISGQLPLSKGNLKYKGKLGSELDVEQGYEAARLAAINCISVIKAAIGDFKLLEKIVKVEGYVASSENFSKHANVVNGASEFLYELLGDTGTHARIAVGVSSLPLNSPVEIALIAELSPDFQSG